jgi:TolB-like protein
VKIHDLKVIALTSVLQYKNTRKRISEIGQELEVAAIKVCTFQSAWCVESRRA